MVYLDINLILFRTQEGLGGLQSPSLIAHTAHTSHTVYTAHTAHTAYTANTAHTTAATI